jgi:hypothetical protein
MFPYAITLLLQVFCIDEKVGENTCLEHSVRYVVLLPKCLKWKPCSNQLLMQKCHFKWAWSNALSQFLAFTRREKSGGSSPHLAANGLQFPNGVSNPL